MATRKPGRAAAGAGGDGTQAIRRATSILKTIARATPDSVSLADIARAEKLPKSTAHRMLKCLLEEGLVDQPAGGVRYQMGALAYELGLAAPRSALEVARWREVVESVARRTGQTTYLMRRTGLEAVCLLKAEGHAVVRVIPVEVGQRRFLGVGAGATALLAALDDATVEHCIRVIAPELEKHPRITPASLREAVRQTRKEGIAVSRGRVVEQSFGLGMAIPDGQGAPTLAISAAAHMSLVTEADAALWAQIIRSEIEGALRTQKGRRG